MGEMVDRVARAIYEEGLVRARMVDHTHEAVLAVARAAIAAMREPTEAMLECAGSAEDYADRDNIFAHAWRAMIDAAQE